MMTTNPTRTHAQQQALCLPGWPRGSLCVGSFHGGHAMTAAERERFKAIQKRKIENTPAPPSKIACRMVPSLRTSHTTIGCGKYRWNPKGITRD